MPICSLTSALPPHTPDVKRWIGALLVLLAAAAILAALRYTPPPEPTYHGKGLSFWIEEHRVQSMLISQNDKQATRRTAEARQAIWAIGMNALPHLIAWIRYQPPQWGTRFLPWTPLRLRHNVDRILFSQERANREQAAMQALEVIGTNAVPAIPELARIVRDTKHRAKAHEAALTLNLLGPEAVPALLYAWSNAIPADQAYLSAVIASGLAHNINSRDQLLCLIPILQTHSEPLRSAAYEVVSRIAPDLLTNAPAK
jgi:hypothetical protein